MTTIPPVDQATRTRPPLRSPAWPHRRVEIVTRTPEQRMRLGYGCAWWHPRESTWAYVGIRLREALMHRVDVVDVEAQRTPVGKALLRSLYAIRRDVPWQYSALERAMRDRSVRRQVERLEVDALLGIGDVDTPTSAPTFLYQDCNLAADLEIEANTGESTRNALPSSTAVRARLGEEQLRRARCATGVFAMSGWYRDYLVANGVDGERVLVAGGGINNLPATYRDVSRPPQGKLLFVGTHFIRKGGDIVVEATRRLLAGGREMRLTIVGPGAWPLSSSPPPFVDFRGTVGPRADPTLYPSHDLYVMPSRVEPYGLPFLEALVAGLPCVGRRAFAMPEIIDDGVTGALVDTDDPDELAEAIEQLLDDPEIYFRVASRREDLLARHSWDQVAGRIVRGIDQQFGTRPRRAAEDLFATARAARHPIDEF